MVRPRPHRLADPLPDSADYAPESTPELKRYARYHQSIKLAQLAMLHQRDTGQDKMMNGKRSLQWSRQHSLKAAQRSKYAQNTERLAATNNTQPVVASISIQRETRADDKKVAAASDNWLLSECGPALSRGSLSKKNVTVVPIESGAPAPTAANSLRASTGGGASTFAIHEFELGNVLKPAAPYRKPVFEVFPKVGTNGGGGECDEHCCCCAPKFTGGSRPNARDDDAMDDKIYECVELPAPPPELLLDTSPDEEPPVKFDRPTEIPGLQSLAISPPAGDCAKRSPSNQDEADSGRFSAQGSGSGTHALNSDSCECGSSVAHASTNSSSSRSCPDLSSPTDLSLNGVAALCDNETPTDAQLDITVQRVQCGTSKASRSSNGSGNSERWRQVPVKDWQSADLFQFLNSSNLDGAASVLIGYEFTGEDIIAWDDETLCELGIADSKSRRKLLRRLELVKNGEHLQNKEKRCAQWQQARQPLFNLVRSSSFDQIVAVETRLNGGKARLALSVAETNGAGLQVTKAIWPLRLGDCILEVNSIATQSMAAVDFNQILLSNEGETPLRLVVLRKNRTSADSNECAEADGGRAALTPESDFAIMHF